MSASKRYIEKAHLKAALSTRLEKTASAAEAFRQLDEAERLLREAELARDRAVNARNAASGPVNAIKAQDDLAAAQTAYKRAEDTRNRIRNGIDKQGLKRPSTGLQEIRPPRQVGGAPATRLARLKMGGKVLGGLAITGAAAAGLAKVLKRRKAVTNLSKAPKAQKLVEMIKRNPKKSMAAGAVGVSGLGAGLAALSGGNKLEKQAKITRHLKSSLKGALVGAGIGGLGEAALRQRHLMRKDYPSLIKKLEKIKADVAKKGGTSSPDLDERILRTQRDYERLQGLAPKPGAVLGGAAIGGLAGLVRSLRKAR